MRSSRVTGKRSSSLYAGMTTDRDFVGSEKMDGGGTCKIAAAYKRSRVVSAKHLCSFEAARET